MKTTWPILRRYDAEHLDRVALPLGGIGTGTVSLGGRGDLRDWEVMNTPRKGFVPGVDSGMQPHPSAVLWYRVGRNAPVTRLLEGPVPLDEYEGYRGAETANHGLPRFSQAEFRTAYPLAEIRLRDRAVPLRVTLQAFNPLVPGDVDASSWPLASLCYRLENPTRQTITAAVCVSVPNFFWRGKPLVRPRRLVARRGRDDGVEHGSPGGLELPDRLAEFELGR